MNEEKIQSIKFAIGCATCVFAVWAMYMMYLKGRK
jgi:hypothetical protein